MTLSEVPVIYLICTGGVVLCGLAVMVAATVNIIVGMTRRPAQEKENEAEVPRYVRKPRNKAKIQCEKCGADASEAQVTMREMIDDATLDVRECPKCSATIKTPAKLPAA